MSYYIGIDGGGTNARLLAVNENGKCIGSARGGSTNIASNPPEKVLENLQGMLRECQERYGLEPEECAGLCIGTAGADSAQSRRTVEELLFYLPAAGPRKVVNDAVIALYAASKGGPGVILISGTGSIAYGINGRGETFRAGGHDYLVGDEGSAYWVAKEGVSAALRFSDGTGGETSLLRDLCGELRISSAEELADYVYSHNKSDLAALCGIVSAAAGRGDHEAVRIMDRAAEKLILLVKAVLRKLEMAGEIVPLVPAGGFLKNDMQLRGRFEDALRRESVRVRLMEPEMPAQWGAAMLARDLAGKDTG
ncbi:MAG: hypothetical protein J6I56_06245 [Lachnospiraceae bacterium]|nr:hypothetical protein [Lachnospiraceae bacterium]